MEYEHQLSSIRPLSVHAFSSCPHRWLYNVLVSFSVNIQAVEYRSDWPKGNTWKEMSFITICKSWISEKTFMLFNPENQPPLATCKIPTSKAPRRCLLFYNLKSTGHQVETGPADLQKLWEDLAEKSICLPREWEIDMIRLGLGHTSVKYGCCAAYDIGESYSSMRTMTGVLCKKSSTSVNLDKAVGQFWSGSVPSMISLRNSRRFGARLLRFWKKPASSNCKTVSLISVLKLLRSSSIVEPSTFCAAPARHQHGANKRHLITYREVQI